MLFNKRRNSIYLQHLKLSLSLSFSLSLSLSLSLSPVFVCVCVKGFLEQPVLSCQGLGVETKMFCASSVFLIKDIYNYFPFIPNVYKILNVR